jgi:hypothetical protein
MPKQRWNVQSERKGGIVSLGCFDGHWHHPARLISPDAGRTKRRIPKRNSGKPASSYVSLGAARPELRPGGVT